MPGTELELEAAIARRIVLADRAEQEENAIRLRFGAQAKLDAELVAAGLEKTVKFSIGEPHLDASPVEAAALKDIVEIRDVLPRGYSPTTCIPEYISYVAKFFSSRLGFETADDEVLITAGCTGALAATSAVFLQAGRKVIFPEPGFPAQPPAMTGLGAEILHLPTHETNFRISPELLDKMLQENPETAMIVLADPTNPTGIKYTTAELAELGKVLEEYPHVVIFSDETYHDLALDPEAKSFLKANPGLKDRTIVAYSTSKDTMGDPGVRGGMIRAPKIMVTDKTTGKKVEVNIAKKIAAQQLRTTVAPATLTQYLVARACEAEINMHYDKASKTWKEGGRCHEEHMKWKRGIKAEYSGNLALGKDMLEQAGMPVLVEPGGGFFLFANASKFIGRTIPEGEITSKNGLKITNLRERVGVDESGILKTDAQVASYLMYAANMVTVEGSPFGMPDNIGALRISVANTAEKIREIPARVEFAYNLLLERSADITPPSHSHVASVAGIQGGATAALASRAQTYLAAARKSTGGDVANRFTPSASYKAVVAGGDSDPTRKVQRT